MSSFLRTPSKKPYYFYNSFLALLAPLFIVSLRTRLGISHTSCFPLKTPPDFTKLGQAPITLSPIFSYYTV